MNFLVQSNLASRALELFAGLTSSDGYKALLSHLGPDKKVRSLMIDIVTVSFLFTDPLGILGKEPHARHTRPTALRFATPLTLTFRTAHLIFPNIPSSLPFHC